MKTCTTTRRLLLGFLIAALFCPTATVWAQVDAVSGQRAQITREQLQSLLEHFEQVANSSSESSALRAHARQEAAMIRNRLERGDFQVGDQVTVTVEGEAELSGTFTVEPGPVIVFPMIGPISMEGVLRAELVSHLTQELSRYLLTPSVRASSAIRVLITGGVGQPGYYMVPTNLVISDLLSVAGGMSRQADMKRIHIERRDDQIWGGEALQTAIVEGRTLDQMSIRAGDEVVVPEGSSSVWATVRNATVIITPVLLILRLVERL